MWNKIFTVCFSGRVRKPIIVIPTQERRKDEQYAQIGEAACDLAAMGLRVIVDNDSGLLDFAITNHEFIIEMEPMSIELINKMPQIQKLIDFLKNEDLYDEVFQNSIKNKFLSYLYLFLFKKMQDSCSSRWQSNGMVFTKRRMACRILYDNRSKVIHLLYIFIL